MLVRIQISLNHPQMSFKASSFPLLPSSGFNPGLHLVFIYSLLTKYSSFVFPGADILEENGQLASYFAEVFLDLVRNTT